MTKFDQLSSRFGLFENDISTQVSSDDSTKQFELLDSKCEQLSTKLDKLSSKYEILEEDLVNKSNNQDISTKVVELSTKLENLVQTNNPQNVSTPSTLQEQENEYQELLNNKGKLIETLEHNNTQKDSKIVALNQQIEHLQSVVETQTTIESLKSDIYDVETRFSNSKKLTS